MNQEQDMGRNLRSQGLGGCGCTLPDQEPRDVKESGKAKGSCALPSLSRPCFLADRMSQLASDTCGCQGPGNLGP